MRSKRLLPLLALLLASAPPAAAQTQGDTTGLARAIASVLADSLLSRRQDPKPAVWVYARNPLDSAVAAILLPDSTRLRLRTAGNAFAFHINIHDVSISPDTAHVTMTVWQRDSRRNDGINGHREDTDLVFVRDGAGWRFVNHQPLRLYDTGSVRG